MSALPFEPTFVEVRYSVANNNAADVILEHVFLQTPSRVKMWDCSMQQCPAVLIPAALYEAVQRVKKARVAERFAFAQTDVNAYRKAELELHDAVEALCTLTEPTDGE